MAILTRLREDRALALRVLAVAALVLAAAGAPVWGDRYTVYLLTQAFLYAALAVSLDLVWGHAGILDLGHAVWFGLGALTVGVMTTRVGADGMVVGVHGGTDPAIALRDERARQLARDPSSWTRAVLLFD